MDIISRNDVLKRLEKSEFLELKHAAEVINKLLTETVSLPVRVAFMQLGSTLSVRQQMDKALKDRGWTVVRVGPTKDDSFDGYEIS